MIFTLSTFIYGVRVMLWWHNPTMLSRFWKLSCNVFKLYSIQSIQLKLTISKHVCFIAIVRLVDSFINLTFWMFTQWFVLFFFGFELSFNRIKCWLISQKNFSRHSIYWLSNAKASDIFLNKLSGCAAKINDTLFFTMVFLECEFLLHAKDEHRILKGILRICQTMYSKIAACPR